MSLDSIVVSLVKTSLNSLVSKNTDSQRRLLRLKHKSLSIHFTDIKKTVFFVFDKEISVSSASTQQADCSVIIAIAMTPKLKDKTQLTHLIKEDKLKLDGDIDVLQQFVSLLEELNFDIAEWLSYYTGDVIAHSLATGAKSAFSQINTFAKKQQRYLSEVIIEEWKFTPSMLEIAYFVDCVDDVQSKASLLESRLRAIETKLNSKTK